MNGEEEDSYSCIAERSSSETHRCIDARTRARAVCASRILKTYTSDGKSGVKYKSVMPPKNSVGAEPPVFRSPLHLVHPLPRFVLPRTLFRSARIALLFLPLFLFFSLSFSLFFLTLLDNNVQLECALCVLRCAASAQVRFHRMLDRANEITIPRMFFFFFFNFNAKEKG